MIEERVGWLGKFIVGVIGAAWGLATFFVIPVLVYEQLGPIEAVKQSAAMFKKTWGERLAGSFSFGLLAFLLAIPGVGMFFLAAFVASTSGVLALLIIATAVLYLITLATVSAALNGIFVAALYQYAHTGKASGPFTPELLSGAWRPK